MKKLSIIGLLFVSSCSLNEAETIVADLQTLAALQAAMENSIAYNDSLFATIGSGNETFAFYCDSMFHFHDSLYEVHHQRYGHQGSYDDHAHNGMGMHQSGGGMMGNYHWQDGHHTGQHAIMDSLRISHVDIHPKH